MTGRVIAEEWHHFTKDHLQRLPIAPFLSALYSCRRFGLNEWWALPNAERSITRHAENGLFNGPDACGLPSATERGHRLLTGQCRFCIP